jgi:hypothetical protein
MSNNKLQIAETVEEEKTSPNGAEELIETPASG